MYKYQYAQYMEYNKLNKEVQSILSNKDNDYC
jgi:hypothetical protein